MKIEITQEAQKKLEEQLNKSDFTQPAFRIEKAGSD